MPTYAVISVFLFFVAIVIVFGFFISYVIQFSKRTKEMTKVITDGKVEGKSDDKVREDLEKFMKKQ